MTIRTVRVEKVLNDSAGGSQSRAAVAKVDGETRFLKSREAFHHGRYANFEADLIARDLFELVGVRAPESEVVRLADDSPLREELGPVVLSMEFVDSKFAGNRKVYQGGWGLPEGAVKDEYLKMTLVDLLIGNADRRGANYMQRWTTGDKLRPVPLDNNSGLGTLVNWKVPTSHCNFINSFDGAGDKPGIRMNGTPAAILMDTTLHRDLLDEPEEHARAIELAKELAQDLTDERIQAMVAKLPPEILPEDPKISLKGMRKAIGSKGLELLSNGLKEGMTQEELFQLRKDQIQSTLAWRRDHLVEALEKFLPRREELIEQAQQDWNIR